MPASPTPTLTPPIPEDDDDDEKESAEERQQRERTNATNLGRDCAQGNVAEVERVGDHLVITRALGGGEMLVVVYACRGVDSCATIVASADIVVEAEHGGDGRCYADEVAVVGR